jgi:hypothetical protein
LVDSLDCSSNQEKIQVPGLGFRVEYEWNSVAFVITTCPIIIGGLIIAIILSLVLTWPASAGLVWLFCQSRLSPISIPCSVGSQRRRALSK